jgi:hypothetical protein
MHAGVWNMEYEGVLLVPLIMGIVELAKHMGLPKRYGSLLSAVIGIIFGLLYLHPEDLKKGLLFGLVIGLTGPGLYTTAKNTIQQLRKK